MHVTRRTLSGLDVSALVERDEEYRFDVKDKRIEPSKFAERVVGMASADGGLLVLGMAPIAC